MINTSENYKNKIKNNIRNFQGLVRIEIGDNTIYSTTSIQSEQSDSFSKQEELLDKNREINKQFISFDEEYIVLDGSHVVCPSLSSIIKRGFWSEEISSEDGTMSNTSVKYIFDSLKSTQGVSLYFNKANNEFAVDFTVSFYNDNELIDTIEVIDNDNCEIIIEKAINDFNSCILTITKWSKGNRKAKIAEFDIGITKSFQNEEIEKIQTKEEVDIDLQESVNNTCDIVLYNKNGDFNFIRPQGVYKYIKKGTALQAFVGLNVSDSVSVPEIEFINMGNYIINDIKLEKSNNKITLSCVDKLERLGKTYYEKQRYQTGTLYALVEDILNDAGVVNYEIDENLKDITVQYIIGNGITHRDALVKAATCGGCIVDVDRNNIFKIKKISNTVSDISKEYTYEDMTSTPSLEKQLKFNKLNINIYSHSLSDTLEELHHFEALEESSRTIKEKVQVDKSIGEYSYELSNCSLVSFNSYADFFEYELLTDGNNTVATFTVSGKGIDKTYKTKSYYSDSEIDDGEILEVNFNNEIVINEENADLIAEYLLGKSQNDLLLEIETFGDPSIESQDFIKSVEKYHLDENYIIRELVSTYENGGFKQEIMAEGGILV